MPLCDFAMVFAGCCTNQSAAGWERNGFLTRRWKVVSTAGRTTTWSACRNQLPYQQTSFSQNQAPSRRGHDADVWQPCHPQLARAEAVNPLLHPERDWLPCSTGTDHCLQTRSYFDKLCTDPYGIYFTQGFSSLLNVSICWYGSAACEKRHGWKKLWSHH